MDQVTKERVQRELKEEAGKLLPGEVREVAVLEYGDDPMVEPGEVMVRVLTAEQPGERDEPPKQEAMKQHHPPGDAVYTTSPNEPIRPS